MLHFISSKVTDPGLSTFKAYLVEHTSRYVYGVNKHQKNSNERFMPTLDSGINVAPGINVASGTFGKKIKRNLKIGIPNTIK